MSRLRRPGPDAPSLRDVLRRRAHAANGVLLLLALTTLVPTAFVLFWAQPQTARANEVLDGLQDLHAAMVDQETGLRGYLLTRDPAFLEPFESGARAQAAVEAVLEAEAGDDTELAGPLARVRRAQDRWSERWADQVLRRADDPTTDVRLLLLRGKSLFDDYREIEAEVRGQAEADRNAARAYQRSVLAVGAAAVLLLAVGSALQVRRVDRRMTESLLRPTRRIRDTLADMSAGDLTARAEEVGPSEVRDIAAHVNALALTLQDRNAAVAVRERDLVAARDLAERAGQAKTAFLATMSHEIRTPLNAVLGLTDVLLTTELGEDQRSHLETIAGSGDSLLTLINDVLDFSKIEAGELDLERAPFDLHDVVYDVAHLLAQQAAAKGVDLLVDIPGDRSWAVVGDGARLRQVLTNLVGNAVKFTPSGQVVLSLSAVPLAGRLACRIAVADTGIGIPREQHHRLFKSFSQVDASTTRSYGGTGLGLAISRRIADAMQGDITVQSEVGVGSTFVLSVVLEVAEQAEDPAAAATLVGRRLLVVDDNETNLRILEHQLGTAGATTVPATSGAAALELAGRDGGFDACLLDLHMPGMDGDELAERLRALSGLSGVPLVLLSSSTALEPARCAAFAARLHKPVRPERLVQAVHAVLQRPTRRPAPPTASAVTPSGRSLRILVAEDHAVNAQLIGHYLRQLGHEGTFVTDGEQAVRAVLDGTFDVVLMDAQMPVLGGVDATAAIRLLPGAQPRIIALTASVLASDRTAFLAAGADDFLTKPVRLAVLAAALDAWAPAAPAPEPATPAADDVLDAELVEELRDLGDEAFTHLYGTYADSLLSTVEALLAAADGDLWSEDDEQSVPRLAHRLKGSSAAMGASRVAAVCQRLQVLTAAPPADELRSTLGELQAESRRAGAAVASLLDA